LKGNQAFASKWGCSWPCNDRHSFLALLTIIHKSLSLQVQLHPCFDVKDWLPFKIAQGTVKWSISTFCMDLQYCG
jgi:hypothetical protein